MGQWIDDENVGTMSKTSVFGQRKYDANLLYQWDWILKSIDYHMKLQRDGDVRSTK